jgi:phosphatidylglycerophosphate synthase
LHSVWVASIILGRDVGLAIAAIYYRWISLPPPKTFTRYWDFSLPSAEVRPTTISKYNTFLQLALVGLTTAAPLLSVDLATTLTVMQYVFVYLPLLPVERVVAGFAYFPLQIRGGYDDGVERSELCFRKRRHQDFEQALK